MRRHAAARNAGFVIFIVLMLAGYSIVPSSAKAVDRVVGGFDDRLEISDEGWRIGADILSRRLVVEPECRDVSH